MSETPTLTVPTAFNDIPQLAEGMSDRVDDERLMLYGPDAVEENSWIRFSVLLMDQSIALAGVGRAVASIDGGDERPEVARYDIVLDSLQLEGMSEVIYERMLAYRAGAFDGPATGEVSAEAVAAAEAEAAAATQPETYDGGEAGDEEAPSQPMVSEDDSATVAGSVDAIDSLVEASVEAGQDHEEVPEDVPADYAEMAGEGATVVAQALPEDDPGLASDGYEDAGPTEVFADEDDVAEAPEALEASEPAYDEGADVADGGYAEAAAEDVTPAEVSDYESSDGFGDAPTDTVEAPAAAEDWGTSEIDLAKVEDVADIDAPASAPLPEAPVAPSGFTLTPMNGALTRQSQGATWEPNLALAPEPRASSGLFAYGGELPVPEHAPRPDLDPSDRIRPAPHPVEPGSAVAVAEEQSASGHVADDASASEYVADDAVEYATDDVEEAGEAGEPQEYVADETEVAGEDYASDEYSVPDDAVSFDDDTSSELEAGEPFQDPPVESDEQETRMDVELPK